MDNELSINAQQPKDFLKPHQNHDPLLARPVSPPNGIIPHQLIRPLRLPLPLQPISPQLLGFKPTCLSFFGRIPRILSLCTKSFPLV